MAISRKGKGEAFMSADDSEKPNAIPKDLEKAIANLARVTVQRGLDPGRVLAMLMRIVEWRNTVWTTLSHDQKDQVRALLRRMRHHGEAPPKGRRTDRKD
jgi:hypothetical protein